MKRKQKNLNYFDKIIKIDPDKPDPELIKKSASVIRSGGVVVFPARCLYGLAVDAYNETAVERVFEIKGRTEKKPLLVLADSHLMISCVVKNITPMAQKIMKSFWPGLITVILEANTSLPANLTAGSGKIGIRKPGHPVAMALVKAVGAPITGTSANMSGASGCFSIRDLDPEIAEKADLIIDAGTLKGGIGSTVVDVTGELPVIVREGEVSRDEILTAIGVSYPATCAINKVGVKVSAIFNDSKLIYKGRVFSFYSDNVTLPNGLTTNIDIIRHPGASAIVPLTAENEIILIKQYRYAAGDFIWEIPAGVLEPDETPLECAKRELIEETGYSSNKMEKLIEILPVPGYSDERIHIFLATDLVESKQNLDKDEILKVHKLKLDDVMDMISKGEITDSKTISGLCLALRFMVQR